MNLNMKRLFNIQLKRFEKNNNKFIIDYIKILEKKTNNNIRKEINNIYNEQINSIGFGIIFSYCCIVYLNFK